MLYSSSTSGFYSVAVHGKNIPSDATDEPTWEFTYAQLLEGQSKGKIIAPDAYGRPTLVEPTGPTNDELATAARDKRDSLLSDCDWTVLPDAPLTTEEVAKWKVYRQALRDVTSQKEFPTSITWPVKA